MEKSSTISFVNLSGFLGCFLNMYMFVRGDEKQADLAAVFQPTTPIWRFCHGSYGYKLFIGTNVWVSLFRVGDPRDDTGRIQKFDVQFYLSLHLH